MSETLGNYHEMETATQKDSYENKDLDSKELRALANDFLNSIKNANNLAILLTFFEESLERKDSIAAILHILEVLFTELLKRGDLKIVPGISDAQKQYRLWLNDRYEETWNFILQSFEHTQGTVALKTCLKLIAAESKWSKKQKNKNFPRQRFNNVLMQLLSNKKVHTSLIQSLLEYCKHLDIVYHIWQFLLHAVDKKFFAQEKCTLNYLELVSVAAVTEELQHNALLWCTGEKSKHTYGYTIMRETINRVWDKILSSCDNMTPTVHRQILIVLLERIMPHLENPILLTDFLMDSLENGGAISLLALQGVFTLIQKHNITYPNIYDKLYSMFDAEIFNTKYKARLFYLADIFLSSTHLPESLVAGFVKRLARLSLTAPPQDIILITYFIGNLIIRHTGLKRLIHSDTAMEVVSDPYDMTERKPENSKAIESCLWELVLLQSHIVPKVASTVRTFMQQLPTIEYNLSEVLELNENDIFEEEKQKNYKQFALNYERINSLYLAKQDKVEQYWNLF